MSTTYVVMLGVGKLFLSFLVFDQLVFCVNAIDDPYDNDLSILNLITARGYPVELHSNITTEDNYLLDLQRIPHGKVVKKSVKNRPPILLMPALFTSGEVFVLMNDSIPFLLADAGFDVWIGNPRGSLYSAKHLYFDTSMSSPYWLYSWHEKGYYDLAALIDFVISETGHQKINVLGYSEGTTEILVLCSDRPEYNEKINLAALVAPAIFLKHTSLQVLQENAHKLEAIRSILTRAGIKGIHFNSKQVYKLKKLESSDETVRKFCRHILDGWIVYDPTIFAVSPCRVLTTGLQGFSLKEVVHFGQSISSDEFKHFDYGPVLNKIKYDFEEAPRYDLENVRIPVGIFYSVDDIFTTPKDISRLWNSLPNVVHVNKIEGFKFEHMQFMLRRDARKIFYADLVHFVTSFN